MLRVNIDDYRSFLMNEFARRQKKNAAYSMTAFARDLGVSLQQLSQVLKGRNGLSPKSAKLISQKLNLTELEKQFFIALVESKHSPSQSLRQVAEQKVQKLRKQFGYKKLSHKDFAPLCKWFHWAAFMLVETADFKPDMTWIAKKLGIKVEEALQAYESLFAAGLLTRNENGRWLRTDDKFAFSADTPSSEFRKFYKEMLAKSAESLDEEPMAARHFHYTVLSLNKFQYESLKKKIDTFLLETIDEIPTQNQTGERVYSIGVQMFPLDKKAVKS